MREKSHSQISRSGDTLPKLSDLVDNLAARFSRFIVLVTATAFMLRVVLYAMNSHDYKLLVIVGAGLLALALLSLCQCMVVVLAAVELAERLLPDNIILKVAYFVVFVCVAIGLVYSMIVIAVLDFAGLRDFFTNVLATQNLPE